MVWTDTFTGTSVAIIRSIFFLFHIRKGDHYPSKGTARIVILELNGITHSPGKLVDEAEYTCWSSDVLDISVFKFPPEILNILSPLSPRPHRFSSLFRQRSLSAAENDSQIFADLCPPPNRYHPVYTRVLSRAVVTPCRSLSFFHPLLPFCFFIRPHTQKGCL